MVTLNHLAFAQNELKLFRGTDPKKWHEMSPKGWPMTRENLYVQLLSRLSPNRQDLPNQGQTSRCGPAAFFYCLIQDRPDLYVKFATDLWRDGVSNLGYGAGKIYTVQPGAGTIQSMPKARASGVEDLDWLTMGSLSKPDNGHADPGDELTAITTPEKLRDWFLAVGSTVHTFKFASVVGTGLFGLKVGDLHDGLAHYGADWIVLEIDPHLIAGQPGGFLQRHWVVIDETTPPTFGNQTLQAFEALKKPGDMEKAKVSMQLVCWGARNNQIRPNISVKDFLHDWFGVAAYSHIPG